LSGSKLHYLLTMNYTATRLQQSTKIDYNVSHSMK